MYNIHVQLQLMHVELLIIGEHTVNNMSNNHPLEIRNIPVWVVIEQLTLPTI